MRFASWHGLEGQNERRLLPGKPQQGSEQGRNRDTFELSTDPLAPVWPGGRGEGRDRGRLKTHSGGDMVGGRGVQSHPFLVPRRQRGTHRR